MANPEQFRTTSTPFNDLPWRTDILSAPGGLHRLSSVPEVSVR
jgi:hypothetical protein